MTTLDKINKLLEDNYLLSQGKIYDSSDDTIGHIVVNVSGNGILVAGSGTLEQAVDEVYQLVYHLDEIPEV